MLNRKRYTIGLGSAAFLNVILLGGIVFTGCDKVAQDEMEPVTKVEKRESADSLEPEKALEEEAEKVEGTQTTVVEEVEAPESGNSLLSEIALADSLMKWFKIRTKYRETGEQNRHIEAALSKKEQELLENELAAPINDLLELVAFDWKMNGEEPRDDRRATFLVSWLFRTRGAIGFAPGHKVQLVLCGRPDRSHARHFMTETSRKKSYFEFTWDLLPSIVTWDKGEYYLVTKKTYRPVPNVPYRMTTFFSEVKKKEDGKWVYLGPYGARILIPGWRVDLRE